ncbi:uncharacterized protein K444DRAFT_215422 [Hyaloscypha bicolor E]|uniref:Uncharacterized protein n=1 Tax=Hyaloscypha bicolor E TaxID=1095630 RepID=A0A2J6TQ72_9HELO|nr:uncharacterized protein K444DRAFT_215422 [Hyaloscypha bicolor E]PMD65170.1 hypothetical protein K444DRAFT_215422 [Hyaloscypha bicolor E]
MYGFRTGSHLSCLRQPLHILQILSFVYWGEAARAMWWMVCPEDIDGATSLCYDDVNMAHCTVMSWGPLAIKLAERSDYYIIIHA